MGITFDPINKLIKITSGTEIDALTIYNATMDWCDDQPTMPYSVPMSAVGKAPLGGGVYTDSIFILQDGWKIKLYDGTYQFIIKGTVITDDESPRTVPPDYGNVEIVFQVSSQATVVSGGAGVWSEIEKDAIISKTDEIKAQTDELPPDPASSSDIQAISTLLSANDEEIKAQTQNLPPDPASQSSINQALVAAVEEIQESLKQLTVKSKAIFPL